MKKLILFLDDLKVESFDTTPENQNRPGTVHGFEDSGLTCLGGTCGCPFTEHRTCGVTCPDTFPVTCAPGCNTNPPIIC